MVRIFLAALLAIAPALALSQGSADPYVRLLQATRFVENYKEVAAVSARVFSARNQGSDAEYARFMGVIANADLSDTTPCMADVYRAQDLTAEDVAALTAFFESPLGVKLLAHGNRMMIATIEKLSYQRPHLEGFTDDEKRDLLELQKTAAYRKYSMLVSDRAFMGAMVKCLAQADAVKKAGIKF